MSSNGKEDYCGTDFDNNDEEIFDDSDEMSEKEQSLVDRVSESGGIVDRYAIREIGDNEYSPRLKKLYKDLIYAESCKTVRVSTEELTELFDYVIKIKKYEYGYLDDGKVVIAVLYDDMVENIHELPGMNVASSSVLPKFVELANEYDVPDWDEIDKKALAENIREAYNFDEVLCADVPYAEEGEEACYKHCILCSFEAM
jgi:hypothetical protein